ncbi:MAG: hypothetical protein WCS51_02375 [Bacilli bacterium]|jgi:hypothetical protein
MNSTDIIVLLIVIFFLGLIIFLRYVLPHIGKNKNKHRGGCTSCPVGEDLKAKRFVKDYHKSMQKSEKDKK